MNRKERIYSVTMTEDELRLFSEFLGQKEYATKHYAPPSERRALAKEAWEMRRKNNSVISISGRVRDLERSGYPVDSTTYKKVQAAGRARAAEYVSEKKRQLENMYKPKE